MPEITYKCRTNVVGGIIQFQLLLDVNYWTVMKVKVPNGELGSKMNHLVFDGGRVCEAGSLIIMNAVSLF